MVRAASMYPLLDWYTSLSAGFKWGPALGNLQSALGMMGNRACNGNRGVH